LEPTKTLPSRREWVFWAGMRGGGTFVTISTSAMREPGNQPDRERSRDARQPSETTFKPAAHYGKPSKLHLAYLSTADIDDLTWMG
jgi:hypothetical protein